MIGSLPARRHHAHDAVALGHPAVGRVGSGRFPRFAAALCAVLGVLACIVSASALTAPANAATESADSCLYSVGLHPQSNGVVRLTCGGHTYYCYSGDLCMWRGSYQSYYKCATYSKSYTGPGGWIVNNETGGVKAILYPTPYYASQGVGNAAVPHWSGNSTTGYYYTVLNWFVYGKFKVC